MTIASEITRIRNGVANAYSSVSTMGGTLPATQNLSNLPSAIESIPSGGGGSKYGCTIDIFLGDLDANGKIKPASDTTSDIVFSGIRDVGDRALYRSFGDRTNIKNGVVFPDLEIVSGSQGCSAMFASCTNLTSASFPSLTTISGTQAFANMFASCTNLTSVSFLSLTTISGFEGCYSMFNSCTNLTSVSFPSLTTSSFGSLTNQFSNMMSSTRTTKTHTIHFPSNLQSTISTLTGYPLFGGTSGYVTLAFDLPATA